MANSARTLSFTLVTGHLKGDHCCPYELHATGCRDLNAIKRTGNPFIEVPGVDANHAIRVAQDDMPEIARPDVWVQPCCSLVRMKAIDRAPADYDPSVEMARLRDDAPEVPAPSDRLVLLTDDPTPRPDAVIILS